MDAASLGLMVATGAAAATLLGWGLVAARPQPSPRTMGVVLLAAAGAMLVVSLGELLPDAATILGAWSATAAWMGAGAAALLALRWVADRVGRGLATGTLVALAIGLHNVPEGATSVAGSLLAPSLGLTIAITIGLHNIPEGVAVAAAAVAAGASRARAFLLTLVAAVAEVAGAALVWWRADVLDERAVAGLLALVAGVMVLLAVTELIPSGLRLLRSRALPAASRP